MRPLAPGFQPPVPPGTKPAAAAVAPSSDYGPGGMPGPVGDNSRQVIFATGETGTTIFQYTEGIVDEYPETMKTLTLRHYASTTLFIADFAEPLTEGASISFDGYNDEWIGPEALDFIYERLHHPQTLVESGLIRIWTYPWRIYRDMLPNPRNPEGPPQDCVIIERIYPADPIPNEENRRQYRLNPILGDYWYGRDRPVDEAHPYGLVYDYRASMGNMTPEGGNLQYLLSIESYFYPGSEATTVLPARIGKLRAIMPVGTERSEHVIVPYSIPGPI